MANEERRGENGLFNCHYIAFINYDKYEKAKKIHAIVILSKCLRQKKRKEKTRIIEKAKRKKKWKGTREDERCQ